MIVLDTSVIIDFLRGASTLAAERMAQLEDDAVPYAVPVICYQEVLQGARNEREWRLLDDYLGSQRLLVPEDSVALHREAARIFFDCRRRGVTIRSTVDCLIAAQVIKIKGTLLHDDDDFDGVCSVRPLKTIRG
jgi:predicted nucleic acid-binding protein